METKIAKVISALFHPLLIPTYAILLLYSSNLYFVLLLPVKYKYFLLGFVFTTTFLLPAIMMLLLLKAKMISSLQMENRNERVLPLLIVAGFFFGTFFLLKSIPQIAIINFFILGSTVLVFISLIINYVTKISIHMVAHGGLLGTFLGLGYILNQDLNFFIYGIILIGGITAFARLKLKAHSQFQVYLGYLLGVLFMLNLFVFKFWT
ncbi:MAG: hypothetical protein C0595_11305 [Marinilabiliales bacterium]|nr:MAG: hypothetical protein C0595_11305 [Marinilabiliales bacterium]